MDTAIRNVADLTANERHVYEIALGQPLRDDQRVIVQLVNANSVPSGSAVNGNDDLPDWCAIWADLSDEEIADLESAILVRSECRPILAAAP